MAQQIAPSSSSSCFTYDVFLSFRGIDTRFGFTGNLYKSLSDKGIHTFMDDEQLQKGKEITPALEEAIEKSRIAIVVLSKNYAFSSFCLHELSKILDCFKENYRFVLPVFYDVDPSEVRKQTGRYGEAMNKHVQRLKDSKESLQKWRMALQQVANLSGWHFKHGDGYEHKFIENIVKEVSRKINRDALYVADYLIGLDPQVKNVISLLDLVSPHRFHVVGIHGIGGVGKTTLARAVYNSIADHFEGLCFLKDIRENSEKHGLLHLQKMLLLDVGEKDIEFTSVEQGIPIIQRRLRQRKILLILDDVNKEEQLRNIIGRLDWLSLGSRVIITTRDKHLLACHGVESTYEVKELEKEVAIELLKQKAFKNDKDNSSYVDILNRAVTYASGLPLALEVIGSNLCGKSIQEWRSALESYEMIPDKKIQKILKVSFDALEEKEQSVFLDIACCFKGYELEEVENILNAHHGRCIKYHIGVLVEKSLIKINSEGKVTLHDLIEDMGKEIVRQKSPDKLGKRSRLWAHEDITKVLEENLGTSKIEILCLNSSPMGMEHNLLSVARGLVRANGDGYPHLNQKKEVECGAEAFKKMSNLRTLIIKSGHFSKGPEHLPDSLRVIEWQNYPSQHLPSDFYPKNLSICKLCGDCFTTLVPFSSKRFVNMKVLNMAFCYYLEKINDLSSLPNLEKFSVEGCRNLITVHDSVGLFDKLEILNARGCERLRSFPTLKLPSLKELSLSGCSSLKSFPEILGKMENITTLDLGLTSITEFPSSCRNLTRLRTLEVTYWLPRRSIFMIPQLAELYISGLYSIRRVLEIHDWDEEKMSSMLQSLNIERITFSRCHMSDEFLALVLPWFANLKELDLTESEFTIVPECIKQCCILWKLVLDGCKQLREIEGIPPSLKYLSAYRCESLSFSCRSMLLKQELHEAGNTYFALPSPETERIPEWFEHQTRGSSMSVSFWFRNNFPQNLLLCLASPLLAKLSLYKSDFIVNGKVFSYLNEGYPVTALGGHTHLLNMLKEKFDHNVDEALLQNEWNHVEVMIDRIEQNSLDIGIHVLKEKTGMEDIQFTCPYKRRKLELNLAPLKESGANIELTL